MAETYSETQETRLIFMLRDSDGNAKERTIVIPGVIATEGTQTAVMQAFRDFRGHILNATPTTGDFDYRQFVQPTNWRDDTGSNETTDREIYTTVDVEIEFYTQTKTRYSVDE